jgi:hypothetical protein
MSGNLNLGSRPYIASVAALFLSGCVSGGNLTPARTESQRPLVTYRPEGHSPDATYYLVETAKGLGMLEKAEGHSAALATTHWRGTDGDHFALWVEFLSRQGGAFEYVVPFDRSQPALRFVYPAGTYTILEMDSITRPVPLIPQTHPPVRLIPATHNSLDPLIKGVKP